MVYNKSMNNQGANKYLLKESDGAMSFSLFIVGNILISFIIQLILASFLSTDSTAFLAVNSCITPLVMFLVIYYQAKIKGYTFSFCWLNKPNIKGISLALLLSVSMFFGLAFINITFADFMDKIGANVSSPQVPLNNIFELIIFIITIAILPAIFEELFFRGLLFSSLNGQKDWVKVLIVSLCFALYHCSITQFFYQFLFGVFLCFLRMQTKSTIPCMITHFVNNFVVLLLTFLKVDIDFTNLLVIGVGLVCLAVFIFYCVVPVVKKKSTANSQGLKDFFLPYGLFGLVACMVLALSSLLG